MRRSYVYLAGASVALVAAVAAIELARPDRQPEGEGADVAVAAAAPPEVPFPTATFVAEAAPLPAPAAADAVSPEAVAARIDDLTIRLAEREAALAAMATTLTERDADLDALTATLARREAEIQALRDELAALRDRYAFDIELEALKGRGAAPAAAGADGAPASPAAMLLASAQGSETRPDAPDTLPLTRIHFETGSSSLTPGGQVHAAAAAVMLSEMAVVRVRLLGYADRVGRPDRNRALAAARAEAVADFLVRSGVPVELLEPAGMGEDDLPVATGAGVAEPLNRSVAIVAVSRPTS